GFRSDGSWSSRGGRADAPPLIRQAVFHESANPWCESGVEVGRSRFHDAGDFGEAPGKDTRATIEAATAALLAEGYRPIALGGDHAITYPILRAFARKLPRISILHFCAHPDLYGELAANPHSHACPFARIMEEGLAGRLVQVGIRAANPHQRAQAKRFGVEMIEMREFAHDRDLKLEGPVYVTFDLDGLDPSFAPG